MSILRDQLLSATVILPGGCWTPASPWRDEPCADSLSLSLSVQRCLSRGQSGGGALRNGALDTELPREQGQGRGGNPSPVNVASAAVSGSAESAKGQESSATTKVSDLICSWRTVRHGRPRASSVCRVGYTTCCCEYEGCACSDTVGSKVSARRISAILSDIDRTASRDWALLRLDHGLTVAMGTLALPDCVPTRCRVYTVRVLAHTSTSSTQQPNSCATGLTQDYNVGNFTHALSRLPTTRKLSCFTRASVNTN